MNRTASDKRNWFMTRHIVQGGTSLLMKSRIWNYELEGEFPETPTLYLPIHQSMLDIPFFGFSLLERFGDSPHIIMRNSLSFPGIPIQRILKSFGGIAIEKTDKLMKLEKDERIEAIDQIRALNNRAYSLAAKLLAENHNEIIFPEGTRYAAVNPKTLEVPTSLVVHTGGIDDISKAFYSQTGEYPTLCVLGASSYRVDSGRMHLTIRVGRPFTYYDGKKELRDRIGKELMELSPGVLETKIARTLKKLSRKRFG